METSSSLPNNLDNELPSILFELSHSNGNFVILRGFKAQPLGWWKVKFQRPSINVNLQLIERRSSWNTRSSSHNESLQLDRTDDTQQRANCKKRRVMLEKPLEKKIKCELDFLLAEKRRLRRILIDNNNIFRKTFEKFVYPHRCPLMQDDEVEDKELMREKMTYLNIHFNLMLDQFWKVRHYCAKHVRLYEKEIKHRI